MGWLRHGLRAEGGQEDGQGSKETEELIMTTDQTIRRQMCIVEKELIVHKPARGVEFRKPVFCCFGV